MDLAFGSLRDYAAEDKQAHALAGFAVGALSAALVERIAPDAHPVARVVIATIPAIALGIAKEAYDANHRDRHDADARDALATAAGGVLGAVSVTLVLRF